MADPSIMFSQPNAGATFAQAFQQGMAQNTERAKKAAMAALMADPNNTQAMNALAKLDPQSAMQFKSQQTEALQAQLGQHRDNIIKGAEILRQFNPQDQASYSQALQAAQSVGIDVSQVPQQFDPQYVAGVVKLADTFAPQTQPQEPNIAREADYYKSIGRPDLAEQLLTNHANPQIGIHNPDGTITLVRPPVGGAPAAGGMPHVSDQATYDAVPPGAQYIGPDGHVRVKQGGQSQPGSGGFRDPLAPL